MFEYAVLPQARSRRPRWIAFAMVTQTVAIAGLLLLPLTGVERLDAPPHVVILPPLVLTSDPVQPAAHRQPSSGAHQMPRVAVLPEFKARRPSIPTTIDPTPDAAPSLSTSTPAAGIENFTGALGKLVVPPAVAASKTETAEVKKPVHMTSTMSQSRLLFGPKPVYPRLAVTARVSGTVHLQAVISREGRIENLQVLSGNPFLVNAALDAVRQWRYRPFLLNGQPVDIITEIDVVFTLNQ